MKVLIVGGGIGGLAFHSFLDKKGIKSVVIEKRREWQNQGYFIGLWPSGVRLLSEINSSVKKSFKNGNGIRLFDNTGRENLFISFDNLTKKHGSIVCTTRAKIHEALLEGVSVRMGTTVKTLVEIKDRIAVKFSDDKDEEFDLVVGADGIHSDIRKFVDPDCIPKYVGLRNWILQLKNFEGKPDEVFGFIGNRTALSVAPMGNGQFTSYLLRAVDEDEGKVEKSREEVLEIFPEADGMLLKALKSLPNKPVLYCYNHYQVSVKRLYKDRIVLIGDSCHATSPLMGMGASMALEDAYILADELHKKDLYLALKSYEKRRMPRIKKLQKIVGFLDRCVALRMPRALNKLAFKLSSYAIQRLFTKGADKIMSGFYEEIIGRESELS